MVIKIKKRENFKKKIELTFNKKYISENFSKKELEYLDKWRKYSLDNMTDLKKKEKYLKKIKTDFTYHSCSIEGNTMTKIQVEKYLNDNEIVKDKTKFEHLEIENNGVAFDYMINFKKELSIKFILELHELLLGNLEIYYLNKKNHFYDNDFICGKFRKSSKYSIQGSLKILTQPTEIEIEISKIINWYNKNKNKMHPLELTSKFHILFVDIHPFCDGNGRIVRLLMNYILHSNNFPLINISEKSRNKYIDILESSNELEFTQFLFSELRNNIGEIYVPENLKYEEKINF
jgi:Fic family protein